MNTRVLSSERMLANSKAWQQNPSIRAGLQSRPLGEGALSEVSSAHDGLAAATGERQKVTARIAALTALLDEFDGVHDGSARALDGFLLGFAELAKSPDKAAEYVDARAMLFPDGMAITKRAYTDEYGGVLEVEERITPKVRELLASTQVGEGTLADLYDRWIAAGKALGEHAQERARLRAAMSYPEMVETLDLRRARHRWIRAVRLLIECIDLLELSAELRRAIVAPLQKDIGDALRSRAGAASSAVSPVSDDAGDQPSDVGDDDLDAAGDELDDGVDPVAGVADSASVDVSP